MMNKTIAALIAFCGACMDAAAADWKLLSMLDVPPHPAMTQFAFLDEDSMFMKDDILHVWIQHVDVTSLKDPQAGTSECAAFLKAVEEKKKAGYIPAYALEIAPEITQSKVEPGKMAAIFSKWEVLVSMGVPYKATAKYSLEIDCAQRTRRITTLYEYHADGSTQRLDAPDARFAPVEPDKMFDIPRKRYCPNK